MNGRSSSIFPNGLRATQRAVLDGFMHGKMGIAAVPGSGKTFTLSMLAAQLILTGSLDLDQEVLIVTMSNSAVENFSQRIGSILEQYRMIPGLGYRVRTLHGLAHDIVRENPGKLNLANDFTIIDESEANRIREQAAQAWLRSHPDFFDSYLNPDLSGAKAENIKERNIPFLVQSIASNITRLAKDHELTPDALRTRLDELPAPLHLVEMGWWVYNEYQRSLAYRGAVDFDDLIRLALAALRGDPRLAQRLREQWPYVLEDEAQDSSRLQEEILRILTGSEGHWIRVGDPNQAIYETFTTADPQHLVDFIESPDVLRRELPVSGRSTQDIIELANHLIDWTRLSHPVEAVRDALRLPHIEPTPPGDPQPNPSSDGAQIHFHVPKMTAQEEIDAVCTSLMGWQQVQNELPEEERETLVVLDLMNERGTQIANALRQQGLDPVEVLHTTTATRLSAGTLTHILRCLANPQSPSLLAKAFSVWRRSDRGDAEAEPSYRRALDCLRALKHVEDYLYPLPGDDWLEAQDLRDRDQLVYTLLADFREVASRWHKSALLPIDQVLLTLAQDLFQEPADLAIAHKLAGLLRQKSNSQPNWHLPELSEELENIARNKRRFLGFSDEENSFDPNKYRGRIVITTMHKAKGLEWDRVYLLSCNNFDFPSGMPYDSYVSEKWFIREQLNLEAEALEQLRVTMTSDLYDWYEEGRATQEARLGTVRERLRLLYVGITRAKKSLIVTWNTGKKGSQQPSQAFLALHSFWNSRLSEQ